MTRHKLFRNILFSLLLAFATSSAFSQTDPKTQAEPNYEAVLYVLSAADQPGQGDSLPSSLTGVARQVRSDFGNTNLKLISTYLGRISTNGNLEYKIVSNAYAPEPQAAAPSFLDWRLGGLRTMTNSAGQNVHHFQVFRFGARVPVKIVSTVNNAPGPINYETIGLTLERLGVREGVPTLVGTLNQPKTDGTLFLVLAVRNADK